MSEELLQVENLSAGYGERPILNSLSLAMPPGQRLGLIGPNGCGKSTLLRALTAEIPESAGTILFRGENITHLETDSLIGRGIGYLRQTHNIFPGLTVAENIEIAEYGGRGSIRDREKIIHAFPVLKGRGAIRAGLLSGGERQALAAAMVLMRQVHLLLLDEPLAGLSRKGAMELLQGIHELQREERFAIILVEHRLKLIQPYVDRVVVMVRGAISEDTPDTRLLTSQERLEKHFLI
uniref:Branched-chain amino acid transport system ATP-binding protein n=1 Tax=Candidatus Kentrum sp. MB TaxID=2138164 RepID=A0A450X605_9GAMM|nr:MAG: branched-chain amino acid transport system ATP-binding protein [Candidatus Kentron sp. MB]VFK27023.1 MAG: branched-chain amino acid transport system ATP-binding protein [Candidatus Kentron sp. MB]VFK74937.1 MAG: branched-chain amino acid transport system ATP-binding protein [Candidatus Kentron sp. MB]